MWAYVKNSQVVRLYSRATALTIGGLQYPANIFSSWSASQLKDIGLYSYTESGAGRFIMPACVKKLKTYLTAMIAGYRQH